MRKMIYLTMMFGFSLAMLHCANSDTNGKWSSLSHISDIETQFFIPKKINNKEKKYPVILFLHGAGERGNDNQSQLKHIAPLLASDSIQSKYPSYLVFPQCPENGYWAPIIERGDQWLVQSNGSATPSLKEVMNIMEHVLSLPDVDLNRIYVTGLSMGGFGTFDLLSRMPNTFAAAVPICGGADTSRVNNYKHVPIWNFHGAVDPVVPVELSQELINKLLEEGATPRYTEYPEGGHNVWNDAFNEADLLPWMFSQSLR